MGFTACGLTRTDVNERIEIVPHLSVAELEARYRGCCDPVERSHCQIIWLLAQGSSTLALSQVTGYGCGWIYELVGSYNQQGVEAPVDYRHQHPGRLTLLDDEQQALLLPVLQSPPPDSGQWNGRKVADWMSQYDPYWHLGASRWSSPPLEWPSGPS